MEKKNYIRPLAILVEIESNAHLLELSDLNLFTEEGETEEEKGVSAGEALSKQYNSFWNEYEIATFYPLDDDTE